MCFNFVGGSHLPVLKELIDMTDGPVLELGSGWYSTPYLYWMCLDRGRYFKSYETDEDWVKSLDGLADYVKSYDQAPIDRDWNVVFIDHAPAERRVIDIERLKDIADYIVIHDSEPENWVLYKYYKIYPLFKYRWDYEKHKPFTTVLSNKREIKIKL